MKNNKLVDFEEVAIDDELQEVEKRYNIGQFDFPVVTVGPSHIYFNVKTKPLLGDARYVKMFFTTDYIVFEPVDEPEKNSFKVQYRSEANGINVVHPANLKGKKIGLGVYKVYKCKQGFCFKRYEPLSKAS